MNSLGDEMIITPVGKDSAREAKVNLCSRGETWAMMVLPLA